MLEIREMEDADVREAAAIEGENFTRPWTEEGFLSAVKDKKAMYLAAREDGQLVGYIGMWLALDEGEITNVSVKKEFQGRKIGRKLLSALETLGRERGVTAFFLEVRESNQRAICLYESCGFTRTGLRKNFYEAPREHAVLMCKR